MPPGHRSLRHGTVWSSSSYDIGPRGEQVRKGVLCIWVAATYLGYRAAMVSGVCNFYCRLFQQTYWKENSNVLKSLRKTTKAFNKLKGHLIIAPVLKLPNPTKQFIVEDNALEVGLSQVHGARFLWAYCSCWQHDWSEFLVWVKYAKNSLHHFATGLTPFQGVLGYQPPLCSWNTTMADVPLVNEWFPRAECVCEGAQTNIDWRNSQIHRAGQ